MKFVEVQDTGKFTSGDISTKKIKMVEESICPYLTDHINAVIHHCSFQGELKKVDPSAISKKSDPSWKGNFRLASILAALSKTYERNMGA